MNIDLLDHIDTCLTAYEDPATATDTFVSEFIATVAHDPEVKVSAVTRPDGLIEYMTIFAVGEDGRRIGERIVGSETALWAAMVTWLDQIHQRRYGSDRPR